LGPFCQTTGFAQAYEVMNKNPNSFELGPHTLRQTNIAIEPVPFEGVFPIGNGDMHGYSIAVLVYRTVKSDI